MVSGLSAFAKVNLARAVREVVSKSSLEQLELVFGSEFPTERAPERAALAARKAALGLLDEALDEKTDEADAQREPWFDSEAPTGVAAERPLLPRPPRPPNL